MAIADILCHMKEKALKAVNPRLFTWGSVSGQVAHAARSAQAAQAAHVAHVAQFAHVAPGAQGAPGAHGAHGAHGAYFAHVAHFAHGNGYSVSRQGVGTFFVLGVLLDERFVGYWFGGILCLSMFAEEENWMKYFHI